MTFKLSKRSLNNLIGVDPRLVATTKRAVKLSRIDFAVTCGLRDVAEQQALVAAGASKTMKSKHLIGEAVDLVAYINGRISWELNLYDDLAEAMRAAAREQGIGLVWGAAWNTPNICCYPHSCEHAMQYYIDLRRTQGRRPFIDAPHFELAEI